MREVLYLVLILILSKARTFLYQICLKIFLNITNGNIKNVRNH